MNTLLAAWRSRWRQIVGPRTHQILGWPVVVEHDGTEAEELALLSRLERVIQLVRMALPDHVDAVRPHVSRIRIVRFPCRGAFVSMSRELIIERTFLADPARFDAEIGATLVHEGEHARLRGTGLVESMSAADEERACSAVEIAFGGRVPGGERVLERAHAAMQLADHDVAPAVNWQDAWRKIDAR
jgi:hypothetical protein